MSKQHKDRLFRYPEPISSLSSSIELSYSFRLIDESLYKNLQALRQLRNEAAHSSVNFELSDLNDKLKPIYELCSGFSAILKESSHIIVANSAVNVLQNFYQTAQIHSDEEKETWKNKLLNDENRMSELKNRVLYVELIYGISFICGSIIVKRIIIQKMKANDYTISQLILNINDLSKIE